jgi:hypothetical protein
MLELEMLNTQKVKNTDVLHMKLKSFSDTFNVHNNIQILCNSSCVGKNVKFNLIHPSVCLLMLYSLSYLLVTTNFG